MATTSHTSSLSVASREAAGHWRRALDLWDQVDDRSRPGSITLARLYAHAEDALENDGDWAAAHALATTALATLSEDAEPATAVGLYGRVGRLGRRFDLQASPEILQTATRIGAELPPTVEYLRAVGDLVTTLHMLGRNEEMRAVAEPALRIAQDLQSTGVQQELLAMLAWYAAWSGDEDEAFRLFEQAWSIAAA